MDNNELGELIATDNMRYNIKRYGEKEILALIEKLSDATQRAKMRKFYYKALEI